MLRRLVFAFILVGFINHKHAQIQLIVFLSSIMMITQGLLSPYDTKVQNNIELANEAFTLMCTYVLFTFTDFVPRPETRY